MLHPGLLATIRLVAGNGAQRDPVSVSFDSSARTLIQRAFNSRGEWVAVWLPDPTIRQRTRWLEAGINVDGPDPVPRGGGLNAYTRWARAFVRSLNYQKKYYAPNRKGGRVRTDKRMTPSSVPLLVQVGRHVGATGVLPARRRIRVMVASGGRAQARAVDRLAPRDRIFTDDGNLGARWADPAWRDY